MLYFAAAMRCEAAPLIAALQMKRKDTAGRFQVYTAENACLTVTGIGAVSAAAAVSHLLSMVPPHTAGDVFCNIGVCGDPSQKRTIGSCYLCNAVSEQSSGRRFYPDLLFRHPFGEAAVETVPEISISAGQAEACFSGEGFAAEPAADGHTPFAGEGTSADGRTPFAGEGTSADGRAPFAGEGTSADGHTSEGERISAGKRLQREAALQPPLRDMEAAGAFQAASLFLAPHQIVIAKVVSDGCDEQQLRRITPASVAAQITAAAQPLLKWLCSYSAALSNERSAESSGFAPEDTLALQRLCASLRLSVTQCAQLRQLLQYYRSLHGPGSITLLTDRFLRGAAENSRTEKGFAEAAAALLPDSAAASASGLPFVCRTKKEGKAYFAQLRHCIAPTVFPPYLC